MKEVIENVIEWANDREIFDKSNPEKQILKIIEEVQETQDAIKNYDCTEEKFNHIIDGIGDTVVNLIILCEMYQVSLQECTEYAYKQIKDRKGKMINGIFVKEV